MRLVPLTKEVLATMGDESLVLSIGDEGEFDGFTERIVHTLERVSMAGRAAFVGAEYFGGVGTQWASVYENGLLLVAPESGHGAVNHALKVLGVIAQDTDEFDAVGLGRFRCTEDWLKKER